MSARTVQAHRLGYQLGRDLGLDRLEVTWSGSPRRGGFGGWRVSWTGGPTTEQMRALIADRAKHYPAVPVTELGYDRGGTDLDEAVALLLYLDQHPDERDHIGYATEQTAIDTTPWPERADDIWQRRGRALIAADPTGHGSATRAARDALADKAHDWSDALAWLDEIAATTEAATAGEVIDLAAHRTARR